MVNRKDDNDPFGVFRNAASSETVTRFHFNADSDSSVNSLHHTLGNRRNQAASGNHTHDGTSGLVLPEYISTFNSERGTESVSFSTKSSHTVTVEFTHTFSSAPLVFTNIASSSGTTSRWISRAVDITTTDFVLWVITGASAQGDGSWSSIPVQWIAIEP